jgi:hypothetical protein
MWFGTMSRMIPRPASRAAPTSERKRLLSAELEEIDVGRHVVAVRRALPRLERRRQVRCETPRSRRYGTSCSRLAEAEPGPELEAVGAAEVVDIAQSTCLSSSSERDMT